MTVDLDTFPDLWTRWTTAKKDRQRRIEETRHGVVERWKRNLDDLDEAQSAMIAEGRWVSGRSSLMAVLGIRHREVYHCKVLKWLMTPTGKHGFRETVLRGVLQSCFPDEEFAARDLRLAKVTVEDHRDNLRTDIVVRAPRLTLIIEAKTVSPEGLQQCDATYRTFSDERGAHFVFLTPHGRDPVTATEAAARRAFRALSWETVAQLVKEALDRPRDGSIDEVALGAVRNYLATLQTEFV